LRFEDENVVYAPIAPVKFSKKSKNTWKIEWTLKNAKVKSAVVLLFNEKTRGFCNILVVLDLSHYPLGLKLVQGAHVLHADVLSHVGGGGPGAVAAIDLSSYTLWSRSFAF
jgi:hypothetical protein